MSCSFTRRVLAQMDLRVARVPRQKVYTLPKHLDEKVAALHLGALGVKLTDSRKEQARLSASPSIRNKPTATATRCNPS